jgi:protein-S-isoprenylcysteine O-methyltransferase Ste14
LKEPSGPPGGSFIFESEISLPPKKPVYPPVFFLLAIILMVALDRFAPGTVWMHWPLRYAGIALMLAGLVPALVVNLMFKREQTTIKPFEESSKLVTRGPFRVSRNPIYLGMVVFLLGLGILLGSVAPFIVVPLFVLLIDRRFIRAEEAMLARTFGASFEDYRRRVRRWV